MTVTASANPSGEGQVSTLLRMEEREGDERWAIKETLAEAKRVGLPALQYDAQSAPARNMGEGR